MKKIKKNKKNKKNKKTKQGTNPYPSLLSLPVQNQQKGVWSCVAEVFKNEVPPPPTLTLVPPPSCYLLFLMLFAVVVVGVTVRCRNGAGDGWG